MHIVLTKNHGIEYLQIQESYSLRVNGVLKNRKRVLRNIGPLAKFDDGKPDFLKRLRASFKAGNPIIESLSELFEEKSASEKYITVTFAQEDRDACAANPRNIGYFLLDALYNAMGINDVLHLCKSRSKIDYDLNGLAKLLVFGRTMSPDSKWGTFHERDRYAFEVTDSGNAAEVYKALDCLHAQSESIQKRMHHKIMQGAGRNMEICYYDVTNYYFEIGENDEDIRDATTGNILREGLRKRGVSKENRREPIVQMGLFIDANALPVAYHIFPGNHVDQTTLRPALKKSADTLGRVIVVADGGLNSNKNIAHILRVGNGYIFSKSAKKSDKATKRWMLEDDGYEWNEKGTFKVKSKIQHRVIEDEDGNKVKIREKLVSFWSKKHYDREWRENEKFIEYLNSVIQNPDKLKDKPKKIEPFLKKESVDKETGEVLDAKTVLSLDLEKIRAYTELFGYYTILTSEADKPDLEIIDKYRGLSKIEDSFRITKRDLEGRPVFVRTAEHIDAHFLLCFIALVMIRIIQQRILQYQKKEVFGSGRWESGLSAERIQEALGLFTADALPGGYYRISKPSEDLLLILRAFGIQTTPCLPTAAELRRFKYSLDKAIFI